MLVTHVDSTKGEIVKSVFKAYRQVKEKDERGEQPLYRPKMWNRVDRQNERRTNKMNWFKKGGNISVIFVPATPRSELKKRYEAAVSECRVGMKVVEKQAGMSMKSMVQKSDLFQNSTAVTERIAWCVEWNGVEGGADSQE